MSDEYAWLGKAIGSAKADIPGVQHVTLQVEDVTDTGVNVTFRGTFIDDVPCSESYVNRQPGDTVVAKYQAGQLLVEGLVGADNSAESFESQVTALVQPMIDNAVNAAALVSNLAYGTAAPGASFIQVANTYINVDSVTGAMSIYFQTGAPVTPPPSAPKVPGKTPAAVQKTATDSGSWRGGRVDSYHGDPAQGDYTGRGDLTGAWFWGSWIASVCAGKTVAGMRLKLSRQSGSGAASKRIVHLYLHNYATAPSGALSLGGQLNGPPALSWGATTNWQVPGPAVSALASGAAKGFAISTSGGSDYMALSPKAVLSITFAQNT